MGYSDRNSYYGVLGVAADCSEEEIRRAYRKLAMQWHPDKWARKPSLLGEAKRKFQQIQEAYSVLSDKRTRTMYDAGLFDPEEEYDEGFSDFMQEMVSLMDQVRREEKSCSMEELQSMFMEMVKDFGYPEQSYSSPPPQVYEACEWGYGGPMMMFNDFGSSSKAQCEANPASGRASHLHIPSSGCGMYGTKQFCS
ncbi:uncharacterized protein LOC127797294 isoform X1 [Diospyros lotus]|uniref:uncharacterized protein LOC127797294 isoform X1 n=1 Tax=Diospyros lotus TaxID=55363 RepID=UPI002252AD98|nr:uncharacterized protein LOC127797294 isoform X1 [Diospyros lotus]